MVGCWVLISCLQKLLWQMPPACWGHNPRRSIVRNCAFSGLTWACFFANKFHIEKLGIIGGNIFRILALTLRPPGRRSNYRTVPVARRAHIVARVRNPMYCLNDLPKPLDKDPRISPVEVLAKLRAVTYRAVQDSGVQTGANSSALVDGAAAAVGCRCRNPGARSRGPARPCAAAGRLRGCGFKRRRMKNWPLARGEY